jgi:cytochrome P450
MSVSEQAEGKAPAKDVGPDLEKRMREFSTYEVSTDDAFKLYEDARAAGCPVFHSDKLDGFEAVISYHDVRAAHMDPETFNSSPQVLRPLAPRPQFPPIEYDGEEHKAWRDLFSQVLNPKAPTIHRDAVREDIVEQIGKLEEMGEFDLQADFAEEIPLLALCHLIGFDKELRGEVRRHTRAMHGAAGDAEAGAKAFLEFAQFGAGEVQKRVENPRDDFLTVLAQWEIDGRPLTPEELGATMNSFLNAGHGTTVSGMTSLLWEVYRNDQLKQRLIDDMSQIPKAVEESMRLHTPFFGLYRTATKDATLPSGAEIKEGSSALMCWAAANRDPQVFENPDKFDLDREYGRNRLMTFGYGPHGCMGRPMAQMEMEVALEELLTRLPNIELIDPDAVVHTFAGSETALIESLPARLPSS